MNERMAGLVWMFVSLSVIVMASVFGTAAAVMLINLLREWF